MSARREKSSSYSSRQPNKSTSRSLDNTIFVLSSAPSRVYSLDVDYEYRPDSDLFYLTGVDQEDTTLVLMPGNKTKREILFVRDADMRREHWNGHSFTTDEAKAQSGSVRGSA